MMTEIDLLKRSSFAWVDLYGTDDALMATGFAAWGGIFWLDGVWYAIGGAKGERAVPADMGDVGQGEDGEDPAEGGGQPGVLQRRGDQADEECGGEEVVHGRLTQRIR